jgi:sugar lactone lactonase YvrE
MGFTMTTHNLLRYLLAAPLIACIAAGAQTPPSSYPVSVVDAQIPIVSSDGFSAPQGLAMGPDGTVYVADSGKHRVLKISPAGVQSTVSFGVFAPAVQTPTGLARDGAVNLYVTDPATNRLIKLPAGGGHAIAIIGSPVLDRPTAVASDVAGNLAIVNAGNGTVVTRRAGGTPTVFNTGSTVLVAPTAVTYDAQGMLYVADAGNGTDAPAVYRFPKLGGTGTALTLAGYALKDVTALTFDGEGNLFVLDGGSQQLIEIPVKGGAPFLIPQSNFKSPSGLAADMLGNLYVSDSGASNTVTKFVYNNAANFGSVAVGVISNAITFNYEFYERTTVEATRGIGGGVWNAEYHKAPGGTCTLRTYSPSTSSMGLTLPASCTVSFDFQPVNVGGRPGAVQVQTSNGNATQLTVGTGMGGQLALMNSSITTKLGSISNPGPIVINDADTTMYFSAAGGTYRVPVAGGTPTLVTTLTGVSLAVNGAGDVFLFNPPSITKIPADGSATTTIHVPGLINPQAMVMDTNGAFYISDLGPAPTYPDYSLAGFVLRVSPTGVVSMLSPPGYWVTPGLMTADGQGNIYVADGAQRLVFEVAVWTGSFTTQLVTSGPVIGGSYGTDPGNLAVDASGTLYYWDSYVNGNFEGPAYSPPSGQSGPSLTDYSAGESQLPLYTIPEIFDFNGPGSLVPFYSATGNQTLATSASGKLYFVNNSGPGVFVVNRTQGYIPWQAFDPNILYLGLSVGGATQGLYVYNVGNQNATFTDATKIFTESGNGVGSFTFATPSGSTSFTGPTPCVPGMALPPGDYCVIYTTNTNGLTKGPIVTDTLHFLTNAVNNDSVSFKLNGRANPAP